MTEKDDTYIEVSFEHLFTAIYGKRFLSAGSTPLPSFKKGIYKLIATLRKAIDRNLQGDIVHKEKILRRFEDFSKYSKQTDTKDKFIQQLLLLLFQTHFAVLGRMPDNWEPGRVKPVHSSKYLNLSDFRTPYYIRTDKQRANEIIDYAYRKSDMAKEDTLFTRVIESRRKHPKNHERFLDWVKHHEPATYHLFNRA